jgi:hypothetical protein
VRQGEEDGLHVVGLAVVLGRRLEERHPVVVREPVTNVKFKKIYILAEKMALFLKNVSFKEKR